MSILTTKKSRNFTRLISNCNTITYLYAAFPEPIVSIQVTTAIAQRGEPVTLNCEFEIGRLTQRYTFRWIRVRNGATTQLAVSSPSPMSVNAGKYQLLGNQSLLILDSEFTDAEGRYYCDVAVVNIEGTDMFERGRDITLEVYGENKLTCISSMHVD